jgi:hypothetical protein
VLHDSNINLTPLEKVLLLDHQRFGHVSFKRLQLMYKLSGLRSESPALGPYLPNRPERIASISPPMCLSCNLAKAKQRSRPGKKHTSDPTDGPNLRSDTTLLPGSRISVDHYESSVRGRLTSTYGKENSSLKLCGGTIFTNHYSGFIQVNHQPSLSATDTILSKNKFEASMEDCGIAVQSYHSDDGIFTSRQFEEQLQLAHQTIRFSGVGARHQNGIAERSIQTVAYYARAMLVHAQHHWPEHLSADLWPYALSYATWIHNHCPDSRGGAPIEALTGITLNCHQLQRVKVFGCPSYVLDPRVQDGHKIPKWDPRARQGQFLGFSDKHSSTVGLI